LIYFQLGVTDKLTITDSSLLQAIKWSKALDEKFKNNSLEDPSLTFQYFGSVQGFTRVYPGYDWKLEISDNQPNIYDCRNTMW